MCFIFLATLLYYIEIIEISLHIRRLICTQFVAYRCAVIILFMIKFTILLLYTNTQFAHIGNLYIYIKLLPMTG